MLVIVICALYAFVATEAKTQYAEESAAELFEEFIQNYNKQYQDEIEKAKRLEIFKENLKEINRLNTLDDAVFGINKFSDLSEEEFARYYLGLAEEDDDRPMRNECIVVDDEQFRVYNAPEALDFRQQNAVTEVKNQGGCGSCWLFGVIGSIEGFYALKHRKLLSFSEKQLLDCLECSPEDSCKRGGFMVEAFSELLISPGVMLESDYPYEDEKKECRYDASKARAKVETCYNFDLKNETVLKEALYMFGPITVAINGKAAHHYSTGIYTVDSCPSIIPKNCGHAVLLVGYGTENGTDYWILKNSWGKEWGEEGFMRITRGSNTCALMNKHAASAFVA